MPAQRFNETNIIYKRLKGNLGSKRTFFENDNEEGNLSLNSLDILVYAYLKYAMVNTSQSKEVELLRRASKDDKHCPQDEDYTLLIDFVERIDLAKAADNPGELQKIG